MLGSFLSIFTVPTTLAFVVGGLGAAPATPGATTIAPPTSTVARSTPRLNTDFILFSPSESNLPRRWGNRPRPPGGNGQIAWRRSRGGDRESGEDGQAPEGLAF